MEAMQAVCPHCGYDFEGTPLARRKTPMFGPTIPAIIGAIVGACVAHEKTRHIDKILPGPEAFGAVIGFIVTFVVFIVIRRIVPESFRGANVLGTALGVVLLLIGLFLFFLGFAIGGNIPPLILASGVTLTGGAIVVKGIIDMKRRT